MAAISGGGSCMIGGGVFVFLKEGGLNTIWFLLVLHCKWAKFYHLFLVTHIF